MGISRDIQNLNVLLEQMLRDLDQSGYAKDSTLVEIRTSISSTNSALGLVNDALTTLESMDERAETLDSRIAELLTMIQTQTDMVEALLTSGNTTRSAMQTLISTLNGIVSTSALQITANTQLSNINNNTDSLKSLFATLNGLVATAANQVSLNAKIDTLHSDLLVLKTAIEAVSYNAIPADASVYVAALSLAANPTILNGAGTVYAVMSSGNMAIRDNTVDKVQVPGGMIGALPRPVFCATSIKLFAVLATNTTIWYKAS